jgi:Predicted integral membrane protein
MNSFFRELKQRKVYRVALGYAVVAWLVIQISATVMPAYHAPDWILPIFITVIALGFPVALVLAWAFELKGGVIEKAPEPTGTLSTANKRRVWLLAAVGLIISALAVGGYWLWHPWRTASTGSESSAEAMPAIPAKSIAVLPFENLSEEKGNAYFADGIQDEILARLSKISDLKVISRTSTQKYKSAPDNLREIAKQLGVANILEGSVQKAADQVRVNVQLINALNDAHLWSDIYDRKLTDIFAVESDIAKTIADTLEAKLTHTEQSAIAARPTEDNEAHELYLKGRYFFGKRTVEDLKRAIDYFNQALAKDPNYAPAYAGIADSYVLLPEYSNESSTELYPKARAAAEKALAIDNDLAEAHVSLGLLHGADFNLNPSKREFERALKLNPNYAAAHYFLGLTVLAPLGQLDQALAELKRAVELDPFSAIMNTNFGLCYILARRYPEAIAQLRKATELDPNFSQAHVFLGLALEVSGDSAGAIREYEKAYEVEKAHGTGAKDVGSPWLAYAYALQGEREKALQLLGQLEDLERRNGGVFAFGLAMVHLRLGQKEQAIDWLERSHLKKELPTSFIKVNPELDPLRGDVRFEKLANQIIPPVDAR